MVIILLIGGFLGWRLVRAGEDKFKPLTVHRTDLTEKLSFSGKIDAAEKSTMTFQSTGKLAFVRVKEGDIVKKGQVLAGLDTGDLAAAERAAFYRYIAADANAKQVEDSVKGHDKDESYAQKTSRVAAQTDRDIKYDAWLTARRALAYATIYSPINGIVVTIPPTSPGEFITATNTIAFEIVNLATIYFSASADQTDVTRIKIGQKGELVLDAYPEESVAAIVSNISFTPKGDETGTVYEMRLIIPSESPDFKFRLGMTGDVTFVIQELKGIIAIPSKYVKSDNGDKYVTKLVNGKKEKTIVKTGNVIEGQTEVLSGLEEGDVIYDQTF